MNIYLIKNKINGKFYIGKETKSNLNYFGSGLVIKKAIEKYGKRNFSKHILEICNDKKELDEKEKLWILAFNSLNEGYNLTSGGDGGDTFTFSINKEVTRRKHRLVAKGENNPFYGKKHSRETKEKISNANKEAWLDPEIRIKYKTALKGREAPKTAWKEGSSPWNKGKKMSKEIREKISIATKKAMQNPIVRENYLKGITKRDSQL
jgi:group I intron endonuclease